MVMVIATSLEECVAHVKAYMEGGMESRYMNMIKTGLDLGVLRDKFPCAVCRIKIGEPLCALLGTTGFTRSVVVSVNAIPHPMV